MEHGGSDPAPGILPPGDWTPAQVHDAIDLVHRTEEALPDYLTREQLAARGYHDRSTPATPWDHGTNPAYQDDGHILYPTRPETLVLQNRPGGYKVVAAMYQLPPGTTMADIPADIAWLPGWHVHEDICVDDNQIFSGIASNGVCRVGHLLITAPMLHVWTEDTPCDHRFPGVGAGLMCDGHMFPTPPRGTVPGTRPPGTFIRPVFPGETLPVTPAPVPPSPPATAVPAQPHYTG